MSNPAQGAVGAGTKTAAETVTILYENYRGETAVRRITPIAREWFGSSEWHPEPQWLFTAFDMDKEAFRDFARAGVKAWGQAAVDAALATPRTDSDEGTAGEEDRGESHLSFRDLLITLEGIAKQDAARRLFPSEAKAIMAALTALANEKKELLAAACKPWEHYTGEPPDDGSPLSGVFVAGMTYTERLLAKLLDVTHYEGGDGSEDFDSDATQTLRSILTGARLWDADENRPATPAPATPPGVPLADGAQIVAHLGPHFHAQPQPRDKSDPNWASRARDHDIYTTDPLVCREGRMLVGTLSWRAVDAWQQMVLARTTPPGVPDSVRALSEAVQHEAIISQGTGEKLQRLRQEYAEACMDWVGSILISAHPAGQGGKMRKRPGDDRDLEALKNDLIVDPAESEAWQAKTGIHPAGQSTAPEPDPTLIYWIESQTERLCNLYPDAAFSIVEFREELVGLMEGDPAGQSTGLGADLPSRIYKVLRDYSMSNMTDRDDGGAHLLVDLCTPDCQPIDQGEAELRLIAGEIADALAPDSTRTGPAGTEEAVEKMAWIILANLRTDVSVADLRRKLDEEQSGKFGLGRSWCQALDTARRQARAILAARPAAPEAHRESLRQHWDNFCDADPVPEDFIDRMDDAGFVTLRKVTRDDLNDSFAAEKGIEKGGWVWVLTELGQQVLRTKPSSSDQGGR